MSYVRQSSGLASESRLLISLFHPVAILTAVGYDYSEYHAHFLTADEPRLVSPHFPRRGKCAMYIMLWE